MSLKFRDILKSYCMQSTISGLKYFYLYPDILSRLFWAVNIISIFGFACMLTTLLWFRYQGMATRITVEDQYSPVYELPYPAITMCGPNQMYLPNVKHFRRTLVDGNATDEDMDNFKMLLGFYEPAIKLDKKVLDRLRHLIHLNRHNVRDIMATLPQSCDQFIKHCVFELNAVNCTDYFKPILTAHGLCCVFNSPYLAIGSRVFKDPDFEPRKPRSPGIYGGMTVLTDYNPDNAMDGTMLYAGGIKVMINDWTEYPSDDEATIVFPRVESFHSIKGTFTYCSEDVKILNIEGRKCVFTDEHNLEYFHTYRNSDCDIECFMHALWKRCKCVLFYLPQVRLIHVCDVNKIYCLLQTKANLTQNAEDIDCDCPRDCDSRSYTVHQTITNFKAKEFLIYDYLYDDTKPSDNSTLLHFYFSNPFYMKQKQETIMSLINLMSNLGGVFGMCLGCSLMSLLEIILFIYKSISNARKVTIERRPCK